jgi:hypothetical protein
MIAAFFGMLLISVWYGTRVQALTLSTVTVLGGETVPAADIEAIVRKELDGAYLKFVPKAFALTYPHDAVVNSVTQHPKVKSAVVTPLGKQELRVEFFEYMPHALWCSPIDLTQCHYLDEEGFAFAVAPKLEGGTLLRLVSIGKNPEAENTPFTPEQFAVVEELVARLAEAKWYVSHIEIDAAGDAYFSLVGGGEFKISLGQTVDETMSNLLTILGSEQFAHIAPGNFEYIDLRFGSKVFVNEVTYETSASSTASTTAAAAAIPTEIQETAPPLATTTTAE